MVGDGHLPSEPAVSVLTFHCYILTIVWCGLANLGMIFPLFRHTVITYYLHAITMWIVAILTFVGTIIQIIVPNHDL